jgi:hypothetical protein
MAYYRDDYSDPDAMDYNPDSTKWKPSREYRFVRCNLCGQESLVGDGHNCSWLRDAFSDKSKKPCK